MAFARWPSSRSNRSRRPRSWPARRSSTPSARRLLDGEPAARLPRVAGARGPARRSGARRAQHAAVRDRLGHILDHCGASVVLCDDEFEPLAHEAIAAGHSSARVIATTEYERLIDQAPEVWHGVEDERGLLSIDYTSGTTGRAKGVMYHHRGAYLQSLAMAFHSQLSPDSVFLWTLPMFHCNGWCFTSAVTATGARHVCLPRLDPAADLEADRRGGGDPPERGADGPDRPREPSGSATGRAGRCGPRPAARRRRRRCSSGSPGSRSRSPTSTA